ncbi:MAG: group II intron reverse transcriptase/maturase [Methanobrevibacter sp. CfCl-M3]
MMKTSKCKVLKSTFPDKTDWNAINWHKTGKYVDKLQKRIYHAESIENSRKVRNSQRILTNSNGVLLLAIKRVTQINKGRKTPGIDGFRAISNKKCAELFDTMKNQNIKLHNPKPAYRMYIRKRNGKLCSMGILVIIDRIYQEIIRMALEPQSEVNFEPTSYGFRPKRGCHDAARRIMFNIRSGKWCWVFEGDFKSCFDTISHEFILNKIKSFPLHNLIDKFLKAGYVDNNIFHSTDKGTPQGGSLSPLLANIALNGMEKLLGISYKEYTNKNGYVNYETKGNYRMVRYADDFVIFAKSEEDIKALYDILNPYLEKRGLMLAEDKTKITHISEGFDFLGFNFKQYKAKNGIIHLNKPSKASIKQFKSKVAEKFRLLRGQNVDELIKSLNQIITGTANYWKPTVAKKIFSKMDCYLWTKISKFIRRLHPNKSWKWLMNKYFPFYNDGKHHGKWVLTGPRENEYLKQMSWTPIKRHIMIKHNYSLYDKSKIEYFNNRKFSC